MTDTDNPRGLPVACLVTGGKAFCDRAFVDMQQAMHSIEQRKDGARLELLILATDYEKLLAERDELRSLMASVSNAIHKRWPEYPAELTDLLPAIDAALAAEGRP